VLLNGAKFYIAYTRQLTYCDGDLLDSPLGPLFKSIELEEFGKAPGKNNRPFCIFLTMTEKILFTTFDLRGQFDRIFVAELERLTC